VSLLFPKPLTLTLDAADGVQKLAAMDLGRARVTLVLANPFVRYALVPWSDALSGQAEEEAYVRHHFLRIYGERAKGWRFRASPQAGSAPRLCSAIDAELLAALRAAFAKKRAKLVSLQPGLMCAFNRARFSVPSSGAWIVRADADRVCVGLYAGGRWQAVQNTRGEWLAVLERERHRIGGALPDLVFLHSTAPVANDAPGWKLERLAA
jgi:hypothetical protein